MKMAEGEANNTAASKVRLVRCPKCQKLLPELAGFTVYQCGGCGATLRAENAVAVRDTSVEKSDEDRFVVSEGSECHSENKMIASNPVPESGKESGKLEFSKKLTSGGENANDGASCASGSRGNFKEPGDPRGGRQHRDARYGCSSKALSDVCNGVADEMAKTYRGDETLNKVQAARTHKFQKFQNSSVFKDEERDGLAVLRRTPRTSLEGRFSPYSHEGPSSSHATSSFGCRDDGHEKHPNMDRSESVESLEHDRAILLKKLDELREQLSRTCDAKGKANEREDVNRTASSNPLGRHSQGTWFENNSSVNRASAQHFPVFSGSNADLRNFYTPPHMQSEILGFGDPFEPQQLRRGPYHPSHLYPHRAAEGYMYGQFDPDPVISYPHNLFYHQPACSCPHCCNGPWQAPVADAHQVFPNQRAPYLANSHSLYPLSSSLMLGSSSYNHRGSNGSLLSRESQVHQRSVLARRSGHTCKPVAGGAPFIVCSNCSELLQVPHNLPSVSKNLYKLRCGSCSQVITFKIEGKKLDTSSPLSALNTVLEPIKSSVDATEAGLQCLGHSSHGPADSYSGDDYENSSYNIQPPDEKLIFSSVPVCSHEIIENRCGVNLSGSENMLGMSSSPSSSEGNKSTGSVVCQRDVPTSSELQQCQANSRGPGLPLREHFGYSSPESGSRPGEGSRSKRFDHEKTVGAIGNFRQNSIKDDLATTEINFVANKSLNVLAQGYTEDTKEDQPRVSKGGDSFFAGLIKKSFKDFHRSNQSFDGGKTKVSINGHHIPERLVKKAEKIAGHIYPGEYWYDYGAGFWGVMGQPCLGIVPPFIEEFNYAMPKDCSGGTTGITVNGRELHQKDLDLLVGRGLPSDSGRSYHIDISGRVQDAVSGKELDSLGKLAPTVEKLKRGFGLRPPRVLAE